MSDLKPPSQTKVGAAPSWRSNARLRPLCSKASIWPNGMLTPRRRTCAGRRLKRVLNESERSLDAKPLSNIGLDAFGDFGRRQEALQEGHILRVLQVTPDLNAGGVERTTLEMAEAISRAGGLALVASAGGRLEPDLKAAGGELIKLPVQTKNPIVALANAMQLASIIRRRGVSIVHAR